MITVSSTVENSTTDAILVAIYNLLLGDIFRFTDSLDYDSVYSWVMETNEPPEGFRIAYAEPGTQTYLTYGRNHVVVVSIP